MALTPGTRLGSFQITARIGAGGMGEVYQATDTTLKRAVAIKVLPDAVAADPERLARFQREAEVLAALNHPNIAHIHGLERSPSTGSGQAGHIALVMELVEGPTLADRIAVGPVPPDEALSIARQIAEALEAAHERGIVHRDLKPANIKVRDDGTVKVLDFGLAKALAPEGASATAGSASMSPTLTTPAHTLQGMILGTAAYMSPEQARGKPVDRRTDVWAFGCVLYEMLTGHRAFEDEDVSMTLSKVLQRDPDFDALPAAVPARVRQVLRMCLRKDRKQRAGDMQDVRLALEGEFETATPAVAPPTPATRRTALVGAGAGLLAGILVAGAAMWLAGTGASTPVAVERVSLMVPPNRPVALAGTPTRSLALSPDGTTLVYVAPRPDAPQGQPRDGLSLRSLATREVRDLPGTALGRQPFFSPDGQWVAFFTSDGALKKVPLAGGNPITVTEGINGSNWAFGAWLDDGTIVFGATSSALRRVSAEGGPVSDLTTLDAASIGHTLPVAVPSNGAVLFTSITEAFTTRIEAVVLDTGERRVVVDNAWDPLVLNGEYLLFQRQDATLVAPFDTGTLTLTGPAVPFTEDVRPDNVEGQLPLMEVAASRSGTLAYLPAEADRAASLGVVGRDGAFQPLDVPSGPMRWPRAAPDGRAAAFIETRGKESTVRVVDLTRGGVTKRGHANVETGNPAWQPGTGALAFTGRQGETRAVFLNGPDDSETLLVSPPEGATYARNVAWSPDGKALAYTVQTGSQHDIWILTMGGEPLNRPLLQGPASEYGPAFSPDGRWLAYASDESGRLEVYVQRYPQGERLPVSVGGGANPVWRRDGRELFFTASGKMMAVSVAPEGASLRLGTPSALFDLSGTTPSGERYVYDAGGNTGIGYDILPDGRFLIIRRTGQTALRELVLVRNWLDELKNLAPAN